MGLSQVETTAAAAPPWAVIATAGLALVLGLVIWLAGGRLMKPAFVAVGALIGATLSHLLPAELRSAVGDWALTGGGVVIGALLGWLLFRVLVANVVGVVLAAALTLTVAAFVEAGPAAAGGVGRVSSPDPRDASVGPKTDARHPFDPRHPLLDDVPVVREAKAVASNLWEQVWAYWNHDLDARGRGLVLLALIAGYVAGLVLGFILPAKAAAVTTAFIGPAIWMPAAAWLMLWFDLPMAERLPRGAATWLLAWAGAGALGAGVQVIGAARRGRKKEK